MGVLKNNNVMGTASGRIGLVVFRGVRSNLIAANRPPITRSGPGTADQAVVKNRFKRAARFATAALADKILGPMYAARVGGNLYTPRLVAMSDYLNAPVIENIDVSKYKGVIGNIIAIQADDDFKVTRVRRSPKLLKPC